MDAMYLTDIALLAHFLQIQLQLQLSWVQISSLYSVPSSFALKWAFTSTVCIR